MGWRRTSIDAVFCVPAVSPATVMSVKSTSGIRRMAAPSRLASTSIAARLVPSGARNVTSNCDWSSSGVKFTAVTRKSGMLDSSTSTVPTATRPRWAIAHSSRRV